MEYCLPQKAWRSAVALMLVVELARASAFTSRRPVNSLHTSAFALSKVQGRASVTGALPPEGKHDQALVFQGRSVADTMKQWEETNAAVASTRGGELIAAKRFTFSSLWGIVGVLAVVGNALRRLLPIALEPLKKGNFTPLLWAEYVGFALFMAYSEGFKGFQQKFSPLVIRRAYTLGPNSPLLHKIFAPIYSMGFFHSSRKRKIVSWSLFLGVGLLIKLVKTLSYPYRSIIDAGVVVGLSWGSLATAALYLKTLLTGRIPDVDPAFPEDKKA